MRGRQAALISTLAIVAACGRDATGPHTQQGTPPGEPRTAKTVALESGANLMQGKGPVGQMAMHLVGFHPAKADPAMQMESHHFCDQVNQDFAQCVLYDGDTAEARLHGIEFIISEKLYGSLPAAEKAYWHPHNYEILSGTLRLPNLPDAAEEAALRDKMNSYGKTWHVWKTGVYGQAPDALPLGPAHLAWSFNHDGEAAPGMIQARDQRIGARSDDARRKREGLATLARPQGGVDAMQGQFPDAAAAPSGVRDNGDAATRAVPHVTLQDPHPRPSAQGLPR